MSNTKFRKRNLLNINDTRIAGLYDLEHTIGKGHFAVVKLAKHVFTGEKVAVKVIDKTRLDPISTSHMMQEVRCMKLVQHPNIIRLYEMIDTQTKFFLILELGDYDMYDYIMKKDFDKGGFKEYDAQQYFNQIIKAIDYCHALHVVHRDLKPENVIFFEKLNMVKLTDFGFSNLFEPGEQLRTSCGSLAYSAPEILLGDAYEAPAVDVWSLGVILYMLVCGKLPFQEANDSETLTKILDCKYSIPDYISPACKHLIFRMLIRDPAKRATLKEIMQSSWVMAGDRGHAEALPLICRESLSDSAHATIVEQMVAGGIGLEDEIVNAINKDMYNYMTATYYLLAERVLAAYRQEQAERLISNYNCTYEEDFQKSEGKNQNLSIYQQQQGMTPMLGSRSRSNSWRGSTANRRACTILKEESEEELSSYLRSSSRQSSRNSSPSVSMFGVNNHSRERVSPQAIQELLEYSRLSSRRAASPNSHFSSRSSSPPCSSGRASPAVLNIVSRLKSSTLHPTTSGMRKLSSSPHLLGICEETEDGVVDSNVSTFCQTGKNKSCCNFSGSNLKSHTVRTSRSISIGFAHTRKKSDVDLENSNKIFFNEKNNNSSNDESTNRDFSKTSTTTYSVASTSFSPPISSSLPDSVSITSCVFKSKCHESSCSSVSSDHSICSLINAQKTTNNQQTKLKNLEKELKKIDFNDEVSKEITNLSTNLNENLKLETNLPEVSNTLSKKTSKTSDSLNPSISFN